LFKGKDLIDKQNLKKRLKRAVSSEMQKESSVKEGTMVINAEG